MRSAKPLILLGLLACTLASCVRSEATVNEKPVPDEGIDYAYTLGGGKIQVVEFRLKSSNILCVWTRTKYSSDGAQLSCVTL